MKFYKTIGTCSTSQLGKQVDQVKYIVQKYVNCNKINWPVRNGVEGQLESSLLLVVATTQSTGRQGTELICSLRYGAV